MKAELDLAATHGLQRRFANHLRNPTLHATPPGLEERRLAVYRELLFNNIDHALSKAFPGLHRITEQADWTVLMRDFFTRHAARTPLFHQLAQEFLDYLDGPDPALPPGLPFFQELAHYEWVELALSVAEDDPALAADSRLLDDDSPEERFRLSPLAWPLAYAFPVHRVGPGDLPQTAPAEPSYLVVYRSRQGQVQFLEINAVTARLLALMQQQPGASSRALLARIAEELGLAEPEPLIVAGIEMLRGLRARGIVLGTSDMP